MEKMRTARSFVRDCSCRAARLSRAELRFRQWFDLTPHLRKLGQSILARKAQPCNHVAGGNRCPDEQSRRENGHNP